MSTLYSCLGFPDHSAASMLEAAQHFAREKSKTFAAHRNLYGVRQIGQNADGSRCEFFAKLGSTPENAAEFEISVYTAASRAVPPGAGPDEINAARFGSLSDLQLLHTYLRNAGKEEDGNDYEYVNGVEAAILFRMASSHGKMISGHRVTLCFPGIPSVSRTGTLEELRALIIPEMVTSLFVLHAGEAGVISCCMTPPVGVQGGEAVAAWKRQNVDHVFAELGRFIAAYEARQAAK